MQGTYDGEKQVVTIKVSQNSSTCDDAEVTWLRGKEHFLERQVGSTSFYLDPVK